VDGAARVDAVRDEAAGVRRAARVDENHGEIVSEFRRLGASVIDLSGVGEGCPDLCIGVAKQNLLVEIKKNAKARFTEAQLDFMTYWNGQPVFRVNCIEDAQYIVHMMRGNKA
jgi:Holliday junction resolvase